MKPLLILLFLLFSLKSWSVVTKDCPTNILIELKEVYPLDAKVDADNEEDGSLDRAKEQIMDLNFHISNLRLEKKENSECHYVGKGPFGRYLELKLEGSTKPDAVQAPPLPAGWQGSKQ